MLSTMEKHQLEHYSQIYPELGNLIQKLELSHQMELSRVSHEIRNPVTLVNSFLQLTQSHHPEVSDFDTWQPLMENMNYLRNLLDEFSCYNNSRKLQKECFSLTPFLQTLVSECSSLLSPISISFVKQSAIPSAAFDRTKLRAAILNLIRNSVEAIANNPDGYIRVSLSFDGSNFHICVIDNGQQIPEEYLETLFEPFVSHKPEGSGLGLAIVQSIVQAHNGSVTVESDSDNTSFTIHLPLYYS